MGQHILRIPAVLISALLGCTSLAVAQGLEQARAQLPTFTSGPGGQAAELHVYWPSSDYMLKLETSAPPGVFSDAEFGYLVGSFHSEVTGILAEAWYGELDPATRLSLVQQLDAEAKLLKQPFQPPVATLALRFDESGIAFTYTGANAEGTEVSFTARMSWQDALAQK